ncbi:inositol monophosphatase family protein [Arthrobacter sp. JCM 19049]|uniref:inositol monophosphatase family protein n=1 Tax=Arthrobacter sp. JCM 19049 TaxID=1460643 RepID=UPI0035B4FEC8
MAEGALDAYAEYGTQEYDWAAGALIAEEAGVAVHRPSSTPGWQYAGYIDAQKLGEPQPAQD